MGNDQIEPRAAQAEPIATGIGTGTKGVPRAETGLAPGVRGRGHRGNWVSRDVKARIEK